MTNLSKLQLDRVILAFNRLKSNAVREAQELAKQEQPASGKPKQPTPTATTPTTGQAGR